MTLDREQRIDGVVVAVMVLYGVFVVDSAPIMAISAWSIGVLFVLRHTIEPFGAFVEEHRLVFVSMILVILAVGALFSW